MGTAPAVKRSRTILAFPAQAGRISVPVGQSKKLAVVDASTCEPMRVVPDEHVGFGSRLISKGEPTNFGALRCILGD
jgi:N-acetylmuramic acid 6-phosphate (MurNAc-6-P) etherase